jgi:hypothetical protein
MSLTDVGAAVVLVSAVLVALGVIVRILWRFVLLSVRAFETIVGTHDAAGTVVKPGLVDRIESVEAQLKQNGGNSARDSLDRIEIKLAAVETSAKEATIAAGVAVGEAKAGRQLVAEAEDRRREDVTDIRGAMVAMKQDITEEAAERYADAVELLAEHGGPDLRPHLPGSTVAPHAHPLPSHDPDVTGPPVPQTED